MKKSGNDAAPYVWPPVTRIGGFRRLVFSVVKFLLTSSLLLGGAICRAEDRTAIDPNKEKVLVTIGGVNFDIPLGYFYEKTIWTNGKWPKPKKLRTVNRDMLVVAHLNGLRPWSRELDGDFKSGVPTTRIHIQGEYNPLWLENFLRLRMPSLSVKTGGTQLPGLVAYESTYAEREVNYLKGIPPEKPYFRVHCSTSQMTTKCEVRFDFENRVVVSYSIPITRLGDWKQLHSEVISLLTTLKTKEGDY